jgi:transposase
MATTTRRKASAAQWAEHVSRWQQSGLTAEHFGHHEGLDPRQLRWWN